MPDGHFIPIPLVTGRDDLPVGMRVRIVWPRGRGLKAMAHLAKADTSLPNARGDIVRVQAGQHYIVERASGRHEIVRRDIFEKTHRRSSDGVYLENTDIRYRAAIVESEMQVQTLEGVRTARPGDWVVIGVAGELWPVPADEARRIYKGVPAVGMTGVATTVLLVFGLLTFVAWIAT